MSLDVKPIQLAIRGDDFGLHHGCDLVMLRLAEEGKLVNVSVQANGPNLPAVAHELGALSVCVGLHLTWTCEWSTPVTTSMLPSDQVPSLMRDGRLPADAAEVVQRGIAVDEMLSEADAQLQWLHALQLKPSYVDVHMGVHHADAQLHRALPKWAVRRGLRWIDDLPRLPPNPTSAANPASPAGDFMSRLQAARARGDSFLLVLHPGDGSASGELVLLRDPAHDVGKTRTQEAGLVEVAVQAARGSANVDLCRLDAMKLGFDA